jgi:HEAT repeat protein
MQRAMKKAALAIAVVGIGAVALSLWLLRVPQHNGKPLSYWIDELTPTSAVFREATQAVDATGPKLVPYLTRRLQTKESRLAALYRWNYPALPTFVSKRLPRPRHPVGYRVRAARGLQILGERAAAATSDVLDVFKDPNAEIRLACIPALAAMAPKDEQVSTALIAALADRLDLRVTAGDALTDIWQKRGLKPSDLFDSLLQNPDPRLRLAAAERLVEFERMKGPGIERVLIELVSSTDSEFRFRAAEAAVQGGFGGSLHLRAIGALLYHPAKGTRTKALEAAENLGYQATNLVLQILPLLQNPDQFIRGRAARALGRMGVGIKQVVFALTSQLNDPYDGPRIEAKQALERLNITKERSIKAER